MAKSIEKTVGGNAHDRAKKRSSQLLPSASEATAADEKVTVTERILRVVDSGSTQTLAGIVGSLAGTFLDGRYFSALSLMVSLALYRSKALIGVRNRWILPIHTLSVAVVFVALYLMGTQINKSRPHTYTPVDYANALKGRLPLPISQQITNIYNSYMSPAISSGEPRIDFSEWEGDGIDAAGMHFHTNAINNGSVPALDVKNSTGSSIQKPSEQSEDDLFDYLSSRIADPFQPHNDQPPGARYVKIEPDIVALPSQQDRIDWQSGAKVLYLGRIDSYYDGKGNHYQSELCMYMTAQSTNLTYCHGHNSARRLSR